MLALTHHFIVALAASRAGFRMGTFSAYAVLGDDIVIAHSGVAKHYLIILDSLGVKVGLHKSLVSHLGALEFAKKYMVNGTNLSPVPFKEVSVALKMFNGMSELVRKHELKLTTVARLYGHGYRVLGKMSTKLNALPKRLRTVAI